MKRVTVYTMTDLHTEAKRYAQGLGAEVELIKICVTAAGVTMVIVHWRNEAGKQGIGSYRLRFIADLPNNRIESKRLSDSM